jgi:hypothetical protein
MYYIDGREVSAETGRLAILSLVRVRLSLSFRPMSERLHGDERLSAQRPSEGGLKDAIELLKNARMEYFKAIKTGKPDEPFEPDIDTVMAYYAPNVAQAIQILEALAKNETDGLKALRAWAIDECKCQNKTGAAYDTYYTTDEDMTAILEAFEKELK